MTKKFKCVIDCADCAAKLERAVAGIDGVEKVSVNFITQKLILTAPDELIDGIVAAMLKTARRIEPDCEITAL
ncbi:MAG: cation transporter [Clostridia bacterium]|nr:cation transporter [Clostridia bacterium]